MTSGDRRIEFLARAIANRLEDRGFVEFGDAEAAIRIVANGIESNVSAVEAIEHEVRRRLVAAGVRDPEVVAEEVRRIAAERGIVL